MEEWPQEVINGTINPETSYKQAVGIALEAWGLCLAGNEQPEGFGKFMVSFSQRFKVSPFLENLHKEADRIIADVKT